MKKLPDPFNCPQNLASTIFKYLAYDNDCVTSAGPNMYNFIAITKETVDNVSGQEVEKGKLMSVETVILYCVFTVI